MERRRKTKARTGPIRAKRTAAPDRPSRSGRPAYRTPEIASYASEDLMSAAEFQDSRKRPHLGRRLAS